MAVWCFDYGHGGVDGGAVNGPRCEKDDVKRLGDKVIKLLIDNGEKVILTRPNDETVSLGNRWKLANNHKVDYFVSLHRNSVKDVTANGLETYCYYGSKKGKDLAILVNNSILDKVDFYNRGQKEAGFEVLKYSSMVAILVEVGFISNKKDNELFDKNIDVIANQIAKACLKVVGKNLESKEKKIRYRVMVGSFSSRENADRYKKEVDKLLGVDSVIITTEID